MHQSLSGLKKDLIGACRILSEENLVHAFGHVSARIPGTDRFLLTPRISLALIREKDLLTLTLEGEVVRGTAPAPFEAPLHAAILKAAPGVNAVTRIHARMARIFSVTDRKLEPVHNHGSFFAGGVPVFHKTDLISNRALAEEVAATLHEKPAVLLRGNGQVTVGTTIPEAVMMAIYLEETAEVLYGALQIGTPIPLSGDESARRKEEALPPADLERAWNYYKRKSARGRAKRERR